MSGVRTGMALAGTKAARAHIRAKSVETD